MNHITTVLKAIKSCYAEKNDHIVIGDGVIAWFGTSISKPTIQYTRESIINKTGFNYIKPLNDIVKFNIDSLEVKEHEVILISKSSSKEYKLFDINQKYCSYSLNEKKLITSNSLKINMDCINQVCFSAAKNDSRVFLNGVYVSINQQNQIIAYWATDAYRAAIYGKFDQMTDQDKKIFLPYALVKFAKTLKVTEFTYYWSNDPESSCAEFDFGSEGNLIYQTSEIPKGDLDIRRVIPELSENRISINLQAVYQAAKMTDKLSGITIDCDSKSIKVNDLGFIAANSVESNSTLSLNINSKHLLAYAKEFNIKDSLTIYAGNHPHNSIVIMPNNYCKHCNKDKDALMYVVMPLRV